MCKKILLLAILSILAFSCQERKYIVKNNKVYIQGWDEGNGNYERLIDEADAKTFENMKIDSNYDFLFAKDKNRLYIDAKAVENIDPNTFSFVGNYIFKDKDSAYFLGNGTEDCVIKNVDFKKIKLISYPWAKAQSFLIYRKQTLLLDDIDDFEFIDEYYGKTKSKIIYENKIIPNADPKTFRVINSYSAEDKNNKYEFGKIVH